MEIYCAVCQSKLSDEDSAGISVMTFMVTAGTAFEFKIRYVAFFSGDASSAVNVNQNKLSAQMQEKGRRLAQELPGFNWLEEKIRNGGVTTVLPPKRVSGGSVVDPPNKSIAASETTRSVVSHRVSNSASDAARTGVPPTPSSPSEQRLVVIVHK